MSPLRTLLGISIFWVALSMLGDGFAALAVPQKVAQLVDPAFAATAIGIITFVGLLAGMLVQPVAGAISDALYPRWGRRGMLTVGGGLIIGALGAFVALGSLAGILVAFVLLQVAVNVGQAAQQGFIPDLVGPDWRGRAAGAKGLADVGGAFIGFLVLGALLGGGDAGAAVAVVGGVVVATLLLTIALVREPDRDRSAPPRRSLLGMYRIDLRGRRDFVTVVAARFFFLLGTFAVGRFLLLFVAERLGLDVTRATEEAGALLAVLTLVTALASVPFGWVADRVGRVAPMVAGSALSAVGALLLLSASSAIQILAFGVLMSVGSAAFAGANWAMTADLAPADEAARYLALANFGTAGAAAVAGLVGPLADAVRVFAPGVGYAGVFAAAAISFVVSIVLVRPLWGVERPREAALGVIR